MIRCERQNDLRGGQFTENAGDESKWYLLVAGLVEQEDRTAGPGLSTPDFPKNVGGSSGFRVECE